MVEPAVAVDNCRIAAGNADSGFAEPPAIAVLVFVRLLAFSCLKLGPPVLGSCRLCRSVCLQNDDWSVYGIS